MIVLFSLILACGEARRAASAVVEEARAATSSLPANDDGLAPSAPKPTAVVDLEQARLGKGAPNAIKGMTVRWDAERKLLWHAAIFSRWLIAHDPETGEPLRAIDMQVDGYNPNKLFLDAGRDRMIWLTNQAETIRAMDLEKGELIGRVDIPNRGNRSYPTQAAALDVATGRFWVWNAANRTLNGHSFDGEPMTSIAGMSEVIDIAAAPGGGRLAIIDGTERYASRVVIVDTKSGQSRVACSLEGQPPNRVLLLEDGSMILGDKVARRVDDSCQEEWSVSLPAAPETWVFEGGHLLAAMEFGGRELGGLGSVVVAIDPANGRLLNLAMDRWEVQSVAVDAAGGRAFVGNGGDGSSTVLGLPGLAFQRRLQLASSADDVVVDEKTGDRFILSRLGGSRIYRWTKEGEVKLFANQATWPFALAVDSERRLLLAPSFFEARLYAWPLDGGPGFTVDLEIPGSTGDSIGDLAYDPQTGRAAVVLPEAGWLSVVDVEARKVLFTRQFSELAVGTKAGPGAGAVGIRPDSVYLGAPRLEKLWRLDPTTGKTLASASVGPSGGTRPTGGGDRPPRAPEAGPRGPGSGPPPGAPPDAPAVPPPRPPGKRDPAQGAGKMVNERPEGKAGKLPRPGLDGPRGGPPGGGAPRGGQPRGGEPRGTAPPGGEERPAGTSGGRPPGDTARSGSAPAGAHPPGGEPPGAGGGRRAHPYVFGILYPDPTGNRLFYGSAVLDPLTLQHQATLPGSMKVLDSDAQRILALAEGEGGTDLVVELDPTSLSVRRSFATLTHPVVRAEGCYDPAADAVVLADLPRARVSVFSLKP